ncbi:MAG: MarR family transcriptional regulator [Actinobacteria bacterium]|nr:MarR family transcriptional regulator [Actinomycetota bacterium]
MDNDAQLIYADRAGRFYVQQYGLPPMAGRLLGYLTICDPEQQPIAELADALMASRSAITGAIQFLENFHLVKRTRAAGERVDRVSLDLAGVEGNGFDAKVYAEQSVVAREGLDLLKRAQPDRRAWLEEMAALSDFLARRMPDLQKEWHQRRDALRAARKKASDGRD